MDSPSLPRRDLVAVFLVVCCSSVLLTSGNIRSADYLVAYSVAGNLVESGSLEATPVKDFESWAVSTGEDGLSYARYGLGHSLLGLPGQLAGRALSGVVTGPTDFLDLPLVRFYPLEDRRASWTALTGVLTNSALLGLVAAAVLALAMAVGLSRNWALVAALLAGMGSPLLFQASDFTAEPAAALVWLLATLGLLRLEKDPGSAKTDRVTAFLVGLSVGAAVLLKIAHGALLVPAALAFWLMTRGRGPWRAGVPLWLAFGAGVALNLAGIALYNGLRFGSPLETGYGAYATEFTNSAWEGAVGQLISPGRGLFVYFPAAVLGLLGLRAAWRRSPALAVMSSGGLLVLWALYATWFAWEGGWTYGPRLLAPVLALLCIPAIMGLAGFRSVVLRVLGWMTVAGSLVGSLLAFAVDYIDYDFYLWRLYGDDAILAMRWDAASAPILAYWGFPERRGLLVSQIGTDSFPWILMVLFAATLAGLIWGLVLLVRGRVQMERSRPPVR